MNCKICNNVSKEAFQAKILNKYQIDYFYCENCGFLETEEPYWLKESYSNSINTSDTGYLKRNILFAKKTSILFSILFGTKNNYLDIGGGYGVFTRLMRDEGFNFYWSDPYTTNLFSKNFEYKDQKVGAITCFECFEHFVNPMIEIEKILKISKNVFFSTLLLPQNKLPIPSEWKYFGLEHGQHISFYSTKTLKFIADKYGLNYYSDGKYLHLFTDLILSDFLFKIVLKLHLLKFDFLIKLFLESKTEQDSVDISKL